MRFVLAVVLAIFLSGCASGTKVTKDQMAHFIVGKTTYDQVLSELGKPTIVNVADGIRTAYYQSYQQDAKAYIPIVGSFISDGGKSEMILFTFNSKDVLSKKPGITTMN